MSVTTLPPWPRCRGLECKEPTKRFLTPRNKKVLPWQDLLPVITKKLIIPSSHYNKHILTICLIYVHRFLNVKYPQNHKSREKIKCRQGNSCYQKVVKKHNHYSSSSPCKKYILKILVKIFAWVLYIKSPPNYTQKTKGKF